MRRAMSSAGMIAIAKRDVRRLRPLSAQLRSFYVAATSPSAGLLRSSSLLRNSRARGWRRDINSMHNVPLNRSISFVRMLPKFFLKAARIPAAFGGAMIAGLAYVQYQATQAGNYAVGLYSNVKEHVSSAGGTLYESASDVIHRTGDGWEKTRQDMELPQWLTGLFGNRGPSSGPEGGPNGPPPRQSRSGTAAAAVGVAGGAATAFSYDGDGDEDESVANEIARDDQMMLLTRKMIEIRNLLQSVEQSEALTLPSIVVVGSQSSGKSSVLEAIVGHEFLPKGSNMVTRRPIELTLINTPDSKTEYGEFIDMELGRITDFSQIRRTLTDLNLAVPDTECVSDNPIRLRICSAKVPDLSLIDLPGYIQVTGTDQPLELKEKISELCEKYIQPPNIILAISAADVDLANSTALRASRKVDPRGDRTIGVITKLDLVDPERAANILSDKMYALRLGYVGVVAQARQGIKNSLYRGDRNLTDDVMRNENAYFSAHPEVFGPQAAVDVGVGKLRKKLMRILEQTMASNLSITADAIQNELAETRYEFKVQYNERPLSAETYLAESLDAFKHSFKNFSQQFGRVEIRELLKHELDQQVLNVLAQRYWNKPVEDLLPSPQESDALTDLPKADPEDPLWHLKLDASVASLTKLGIGRLATTVVANAIQAHVNRLVTNSTFSSHPMAREAIADASSSIIRDLSYDTSSELEICIKPYKYRIEPEDHEWSKGRQNITTVLKEELRVCDQALKGLEGQVGGKRKLKDVMTFIDKVRTSQITLEGNGTGGAGGFSSALLHHGREAVFLRDRAGILSMRLTAVKSKQCSRKKNKYYCPEVFLDAVADTLTSTADLFLDAELLSKFYYNFPRELDIRLARGLSQAEIEQFAREDPKIRRHLDLVRRKDLLENVLREIEDLRHLESREKRYSSNIHPAGRSQRQEKKGWSIF